MYYIVIYYIYILILYYIRIYHILADSTGISRAKRRFDKMIK